MSVLDTVRLIFFILVIAPLLAVLLWIYLVIMLLFATNVVIVTAGQQTIQNSMDTYTYIGRVPKPLSLKLNPIWWFRNDDEQQLPEWYRPTWPKWLRVAFWNVRNPLQNFRSYVLGTQDRNYSIIGRAPVLTVQRNDLVPPGTGFQWALAYGGDLWVPRPFISYSGPVVFQLGWQPSGFFGLKLNLHRG